MHSQKNRQRIDYLLDTYLEKGLVFRNYSMVTVKSYRFTWKVILKLSKAEYLDELTTECLEDVFYQGRKERQWSSTTLHSYFAKTNPFLKWCVKQGYLSCNPLDRVEKPRLKTRLPRKLSETEAELVLETSYHMKYSYRYERFRNRAIIACMLLAGLRKSETINLRMRDVDFDTSSLFINQGKGGKDRNIPMCSRLKGILLSYIAERKRLNRQSVYFFTGVNEKRKFGNQAIKILMHRLRKQTGLDFSSHTLRHSFATLMLEGGCDIYTLSQMMGHSKITTTTIYLQCTTKQKRKSIELHALNHN